MGKSHFLLGKLTNFRLGHSFNGKLFHHQTQFPDKTFSVSEVIQHLCHKSVIQWPTESLAIPRHPKSNPGKNMEKKKICHIAGSIPQFYIYIYMYI